MTAKLSNSISGKIECEVQSADLVIHDGSNNADFVQVGVGRAQFQQMVITLGIVPEKKINKKMGFIKTSNYGNFAMVVRFLSSLHMLKI